jgi:hypothetical protein
MHYSRIVVICALFAGCNAAGGKDSTFDPFLRPYVERLKKETPKDNLNRISAMAKSELIELHLGYGMWIRNTWIRGDRDPALVQFFQSKGINDPDEMSMILIEALWQDLNSRLTPAERATVARKREIVARKRKAYDKLETECKSQLVKASGEFESAYAKFGPPTDNPHIRHPFERLLIEKTGRVRKIVYFDSESAGLRARVEKIVLGFKFSAFADDDVVTLYIIDYPHCRVAERDSLHNR